MGMNTGRHRRRLPARDYLSGLALALLLWWNSRRPHRPWRAGPAEIGGLGMGMARLAWTTERIPLAVSYEEHARGVRQIEEYVNGAGAPVA